MANELIELEHAPEFSEYKFHADRVIKELLTNIKTDIFNANEFRRLLLDIQALVYCMNWAHDESMDNMQTTIDNIIVQSNNKLMDKYYPRAANLGGNNGTV
jgi:hypothetical protein